MRGDIDSLDEQIERLRNGGTLMENEVKILCDKVSSAGMNFSWLVCGLAVGFGVACWDMVDWASKRALVRRGGGPSFWASIMECMFASTALRFRFLVRALGLDIISLAAQILYFLQRYHLPHCII